MVFSVFPCGSKTIAYSIARKLSRESTFAPLARSVSTVWRFDGIASANCASCLRFSVCVFCSFFSFVIELDAVVSESSFLLYAPGIGGGSLRMVLRAI